ncbi:MAG: DUF1573 domain-containing protein [Chitinophagaceae bacterium]|nr:DUF1573 domain-containing protein [Chitinophagaceae bacterium]
MKEYILFFVAAASFASCDVRRNDKISDDAGIREDKERRELTHQREVAMKDSTTVQLIDSVYNFGTVEAGEKVTCSFKFKNTGEKALVIADAHASCGCTVPEKPEKPIMPGEIGEIKVVFNTQGKSGHQEKGIVVNSNVKPSFGDLKLVGEVKLK